MARSSWRFGPFGGEIRDGRMYGRGTADMKSGLAAAFLAVDLLRRMHAFDECVDLESDIATIKNIALVLMRWCGTA